MSNKKTVTEISTMAAVMVMSLNEKEFSDEDGIATLNTAISLIYNRAVSKIQADVMAASRDSVIDKLTNKLTPEDTSKTKH